MKHLLVLLGKRVQELRAGKGWTQEEFAHVSGLHRTYIGQIERGEKNISIANLVKISGVLGVTLAELLFALEDNSATRRLARRECQEGPANNSDRTLEIRKVVERLRVQRIAFDKTMKLLEDLTLGPTDPAVSAGRSARRRPQKSD